MDDVVGAIVRILFWPLLLVVRVYGLIFESVDILPARWRRAFVGESGAESSGSTAGWVIRFVAALVLSFVLLIGVGLLLTVAFWMGWLGIGWILVIGVAAALLLAVAPFAAIAQPRSREP